MIPADTCLVWVRYGCFGTQLAHIHKVLDGGRVIAQKWRDQSRRWTGLVNFSIEDIRSYDVDLVNPVVQRAIRGATSGRPLCRHHHHLLPRVQVARCDSIREAVTR